jgi:PKD repeat protein
MKKYILTKYSFIIFLFLNTVNAISQNELFEIHTVKTNLKGICAIDYADFDQDGDIDIGWGSEWTPTSTPTGIHWLENTGEDFSQWISHSIDPDITGVMSIQVVDFNNDSLPDLLASAWGTHNVVWYENPGGNMESWTKHTLLSNFYFAHDAYADYINDDDLIDVVAVGAYQGKIKIIYNTGTQTAPSFTNYYTLCSGFQGVRTALSFDFNQDGHRDILAASTDSDSIFWWRNNGTENNWTQFLIDGETPGFHNFSLVDFDFDGDMDFFATGRNMLALYRNEGGNPITWVREILNDDLEVASRVLTRDFDLDGDIDAFNISKIPGIIHFFENNEGIPVNWTKHTTIDNFAGGWGCQPIDFDGDDDLDIFACAGADFKLVYLKNTTFEDTTHAPKALFRINHHQGCATTQFEFKDISIGEIESYEWNFGNDANPATTSEAGPHSVTYTSEGEKIISLFVTGPNGSDTFFDTLQVTSDLGFHIINNGFNIDCRGDSLDLAVFGADSYQWSPEPEYLNSNHSVVRIKSIDNTNFTISGIIGVCSSDTTIQITVQKQINDDIEDAIWLFEGENGPYTNGCTTVEEGEPFPPLTDCESQNSWCDDGGLQNSIWFRFIAPESGALSISTSGLNNQVAIYEANSSEDLLNGNYTLLAANDDNDGVSANIVNLQGLTHNTPYWFQSDGYNGEEGSVTITVTTLLGVDELDNSENYIVYPNPAADYITIKNCENLQKISLYDVLGNIIWTENTSENQRIKLPKLQEGVYFIAVSNGDNKFSEFKKLIIE